MVNVLKQTEILQVIVVHKEIVSEYTNIMAEEYSRSQNKAKVDLITEPSVPYNIDIHMRKFLHGIRFQLIFVVY